MASTTWAMPASPTPARPVLPGLIGKGGVAVDFLFHIGWGQAVVLKCLPRMGIVVSGSNYG
ncbi:MAG: hypothetical protein ACK4E0_17875 [Chitinophagaceae bacterium]